MSRVQSGGDQKRSSGVGGWLNWIAGGIVSVALAVIGFMQGPAAFEDMHRRMCGWSPSWQRFAGRFGDCAAYAEKPSGPGQTDPRAIAQTQLASEGYRPTNDDYFKAVARGAGHYDYFRTLSIKGDEASLRRSLVAYKVGTNQFPNLVIYMQSQLPDHYASKTLDELKADFRELAETIQATRSLETLHKAACGGEGATLAAQLLRSALSGFCANDAQWHKEAATTVTVLGNILPEEALQRIDVARMGFKTSKARVVSQAELVAAINAPSPGRSEVVRATVDLVIDHMGPHPGLKVLDKSGRPQTVLAVAPDRLNGHACNTDGGTAAICQGSVTVKVGQDGVQLLSDEGIRPNTVAPKDFVRSVLAEKGKWRSATFFVTSSWKRQDGLLGLAAASDTTANRAFVAYCQPNGASSGMVLLMADNIPLEQLLKIATNEPMPPATRKQVISFQPSQQRLQAGIGRTEEGVWLTLFLPRNVALLLGNATAMAQIDGGPTVQIPLTGAREAIAQALKGTVCQ